MAEVWSSIGPRTAPRPQHKTPPLLYFDHLTLVTQNFSSVVKIDGHLPLAGS